MEQSNLSAGVTLFISLRMLELACSAGVGGRAQGVRQALLRTGALAGGTGQHRVAKAILARGDTGGAVIGTLASPQVSDSYTADRSAARL